MSETPPIDLVAPILSNDAFMVVVEAIERDGGLWQCHLSKDGIWLTHAGQTHRITERQADALWTFLPRKSTPTPGTTND